MILMISLWWFAAYAREVVYFYPRAKCAASAHGPDADVVAGSVVDAVDVRHADANGGGAGVEPIRVTVQLCVDLDAGSLAVEWVRPGRCESVVGAVAAKARVIARAGGRAHLHVGGRRNYPRRSRCRGWAGIDGLFLGDRPLVHVRPSLIDVHAEGDGGYAVHLLRLETGVADLQHFVVPTQELLKCHIA